MSKSLFLGIGLVIAIAVTGTVQAESVSFSTNFSGTTLDSRLTSAAANGTVVVNNGLTLSVTNADIWGNSFGAPTVRLTTDELDTRDFAIEAVITARNATSYGHSGIIMHFSDERTGLFGPYTYASTSIKYEDNMNAADSRDASVTSSVASALVTGTSLTFAEKIVRQGSDYTFWFQDASASGWEQVGTSKDLGSNGPVWIGLFDKTFADSSASMSTTFSSLSFTVVPEPGTICLLSTGLLGLLAYAWRKRKQ